MAEKLKVLEFLHEEGVKTEIVDGGEALSSDFL